MNWFAKQAGLPAINIITLEDVPSYVAALKTDFPTLVDSVMAELSPGGRRTHTDLKSPVPLAWEQPGKGKMLLADLRAGHLPTLVRLKEYDFELAPVTAFVGSETQAKRWANHLHWPERLWFVTCDRSCARLYRIAEKQLVPVRTVPREGAAD